MTMIYTLHLKNKMAMFLMCKMAMIYTLQMQDGQDKQYTLHLKNKHHITLYSVYKNSEATLKPNLSKAFL